MTEQSKQFRKRPVIVEAAQWFKNGDHPHDGDLETEGDVVRYFRIPDGDPMRICEHCQRTMHDHGWIDTLEGGHIVCPGDFVITGIKGERYPCKPDIFLNSYDDADTPVGAYDSTLDTLKHQRRVDELIIELIDGLSMRLCQHDASKMENPELATFNEFTPRLKDLTYGTDEYKQCLADMKPALEHHYANNRHHPEHFDLGVRDMNLIDVIEMLCDWKAATERSDTGDLGNSLEIQRDRFALGDVLFDILWNTADQYGWLMK